MIQRFRFEDMKTDISIYLPKTIPADRSAIEELKELTELEITIDKLKKQNDFFDNECSKIEKIILTPDFHKGSGIPIGTVMMTKGFIVPQAMGNDINCGMRIYTTDLDENKIQKNLTRLTNRIRQIFFEGERDIPMKPIQREAMFQNGLTGLLETNKETKDMGIWKLYDENKQQRELEHVAFRGSLTTDKVEGLEDFIQQSGGISYDDQIGTIGGGNHFAEIQRVEKIYDGQTANAWNIKKGAIVIMLHSGSLMIGHQSGMLNKQICHKVYNSNIEHPLNKIYILPEGGKFRCEWKRSWATTYNSANFGFANRMFIGLMLQRSLIDAIGDCSFNLLYDSPHNFIWKKKIEGETFYIHRKGACSSEGLEAMAETPFAYYGEPVMVPGSMGGSSYLMAGTGSADSLWSASHGAGRRLSRGEAIHGNDKLFDEFMKKFYIITPIDPKRNDIIRNREILKKWEETIRSEAPYAYKDIDQVIGVHTEHNMGRLVARMSPIVTIKA